MKSLFKWLSIILGSLLIILVAAILIIPQVVDVNKYKPEIEEKVSQVSGRNFSIGDKMDLSIFPWIGVKLTDIKLGNPEGYGQEEMVSVENFEVRLKLLPLISKQIEVKTFVLDSPVIYLEKRKNGTANWENIPPDSNKTDQKKEESSARSGELPIKSLQVDRFSITNGQLIFKNQQNAFEKQISDFNLELGNISFDKPIAVNFSAQVDGNPISLEGKAGPIGKEPGKGTMSLDFVLKALNIFQAELNGKLVNPAGSPSIDLSIDVASFSPKKLLTQLDISFPVKTADPNVLDKVAFKTVLKGSPDNISVSGGELVLDDSTLKFSAGAKEFSKPNISFDLNLDQIDLDRYLPEPGPTEDKGKKAPEKTTDKKEPDYTPLRKLVMDGKIKAGKIKAHGAQVENIDIAIKASKGVIRIDPLNLDLYQGKVDSALDLDVTDNQPRTDLILSASKIQAGPLLKDALKKEIIEGTLNADIKLSMTGDEPDTVKKTLNGQGGLLFNDGAIIGIDIAGMVRNAKNKFLGGEQSGEKPRTDFAEFNIPFTAKNGLVKTDGTRMISPLLRLVATGDINLVKDLLDMRVEPKFVASLKGQGDTQQRSGLMVPLLITGTFQSPKIRPDLKGMLGSGTPDLNPDTLKKKVLEGVSGDKPSLDVPKEDVKKQIESLIPKFGN